MASFNKVTYVDNETVIHAANLNAIQDSTLQNEADIDTLESGKVDKVTGKGLSTNDFTTEQLTKLSNLPTVAELETSLAGKVPTTRTVNGKALSADVTLAAGDIGYDDTATYSDDTVGKELQDVDGKIDAAVEDLGANRAPAIEVTATGEIASFSDGANNYPVKKLEVSVEPTQDLHGYDNPWPAGGGKNVLPLAVSQIKTVNTSGTWSGNAYSINGITYTLTESDGYVTQIIVNGTATGTADLNIDTTTVLPDGTYILNGCPSGGTGDTYYLRGTRGLVGLDTGNGSSAITYTSGAALFVYIHFASGEHPSNLVFKPMIRLSSVSDATFAPYSNICPISGWTEANVTRSGTNIWSGSIVNGSYWGATQTYDHNDRSRSDKPYPIKGGMSIYVAGLSSSINILFRFRAADGSEVSATSWIVDNQTVAVPEGAAYYVFSLSHAVNLQDLSISLNYPATNTSINEKNAVTIPISFPAVAGTVYGGTLTKNEDGSGVLTVTYAMLTKNTVDMDNSNDYPGWKNSGLKALVGSGINGIIRGAITNISPEQGDYPYYILGLTAGANDTLMLGTAFEKNQTEWIALEQDVQICVPLATPLTYNLTAEQVGGIIRTLYGGNNIWADTGAVSVDYRADTKLYIEKLTAPTEDDMVANNSIAANTYFMVGNKLYYSTTSIAAGATLTVGTNCQETNLAAALNAINS